ncbi:hypothetical protein TNCV_2192721 [Trichonephila clavipes]|nr:hypothetical protein TNCV_2192721 [Trichonephila clavipes]
MGRGDDAIRRCWQDWVDSGRFQRNDVSGRPRATVDREDRLIVGLAVTAPDSPLTIRRTSGDDRIRVLGSSGESVDLGDKLAELMQDQATVWHAVGRVINANNFDVDLILPGYAYCFNFAMAVHRMNDSAFARNEFTCENNYARATCLDLLIKNNVTCKFM